MVNTGLEINLHQLAILFAAFVGNFIATLPPFWKEKFKFAEYDIRIFFDYKFLGTALVTGVGSFVFVSALLNTIDTQIPSDTTLVFALVTAFTIGLLGNKGVNGMLSSPNVKQKAQLEEMKAEAIIDQYETEKTIKSLKLQSIEDKAVSGGGSNEVTPTQ